MAKDIKKNQKKNQKNDNGNRKGQKARNVVWVTGSQAK